MSGSWRAALQPRYLPSTVLLVLETVLIAGALARGADYIGGVSPELAVLPVITALLSVHAWGVIYLVGSAILGLGIVCWRHTLTWAGHVYLAVTHVGFLIGAAKVTIPAGEWRISAGLLLPTVMHILLAWHLGPVPPRRR